MTAPGLVLRRCAAGVALGALAALACGQGASVPLFSGATLPPDFTPASLPEVWTPTPDTAVSPGEEWALYQGLGVEVFLPSTFRGGDPTPNRDELMAILVASGAGDSPIALALQTDPSGMVFLALDFTASNTIVGVTHREVPSEVTLDDYLLGYVPAISEVVEGTAVAEQSIANLPAYRVGRLVLDFAAQGTRQLTYIFKEGAGVWILGYGVPQAGYAARLPVFEQSAVTFRMTD